MYYGKPLSSESIALASMALEDARRSLLNGGVSGRVRVDAIVVCRTIGMSLREAAQAVDYAILYGI